MAIDQAYMTPNLRWGLFIKDHPGAPEPEFAVVQNDESGVPADFCKDECGQPVDGFVRCIIRYPDGRVAATAFREIPTKEREKGKTVDFIRNAENYQKLCTMALGRALKRAGYPDTTTDLKAFLLYEQRITEIALISGGVKPAGELGPGQVERTVDAAGVASPDTDHPERRSHDEPTQGDDEPVDAEIVPPAPPAAPPAGEGSQEDPYASPYPAPILEVVGRLSEDGQRKMLSWLESNGITPAIAEARAAARNRAIAHANKLLVADQAPAEESEASGDPETAAAPPDAEKPSKEEPVPDPV